jgi:hypothetical protein
LTTRNRQGARGRSQATEEKAKPNDKWSGWRKKGTQAISPISSAIPRERNQLGEEFATKAADSHEKSEKK